VRNVTLDEIDLLSLSPDERYRLAARLFGAALARLAAAYEANPTERDDLLQEIHLQLWRSLRIIDGRCSLRTWVYRVAHNVAASHVLKARRRGWLGLDDLAQAGIADEGPGPEATADRRLALDKLLALVRRLAPLDRQVMLLYLEDLDGAAIAEITGHSPGAVATRVSRIKALLVKNFAAEANK
jgi:RNA polymerase sigma factor (sigma-70 family)